MSHEIAQRALDIERLTLSLHESAQRFAVIAVQLERRPSDMRLLGAAKRVAELISSIESLKIAAQRVERICNRNYRILRNDPDSDA